MCRMALNRYHGTSGQTSTHSQILNMYDFKEDEIKQRVSSSLSSMCLRHVFSLILTEPHINRLRKQATKDPSTLFERQ